VGRAHSVSNELPDHRGRLSSHDTQILAHAVERDYARERLKDMGDVHVIWLRNKVHHLGEGDLKIHLSKVEQPPEILVPRVCHGRRPPGSDRGWDPTAELLAVAHATCHSCAKNESEMRAECAYNCNRKLWSNLTTTGFLMFGNDS
jgi:hypothetical protein